MNRQALIVVNTLAQFTRTIVNVGLGFYSTRLVLEALGDSNYGVYTLVAGVVFLLSFVTNAMSTTTQRFLSYHRGNGDITLLKKTFGNIIFLHVLLTILILMILELIGLFLFDGFLNINKEQIPVAKYTYQCVIFMVLCSCMASPFRGLLISHQNLIFVSIVDIVDGILKLVIAVVILYWVFMKDALMEYSLLMTIINLFNLVVFSIFCFFKYEECVMPKLKNWCFSMIKQMLGFTGWVVYSAFVIVGRNQGTAIVLNKFYGTIVNTAFGLASQINSACTFISGSILNAFNPQIIKLKGEQNHLGAFRYAQTASKLCYLFMLALVMPLCVYMPEIIKIWLGYVPEYAVILGRIVILTTLSDQLTTGLSVINKAVGKLKRYALTVDTVKILTIPVMAILLILKLPLIIAFGTYFLMEIISAMLRLPIVKCESDFSIVGWIRDVILRVIIPTILVFLLYMGSAFFLPHTYSIILIVSITGTLILVFVSYLIALNRAEKLIVNTLYTTLLSKIMRIK